ncbi:PREDICTED: melanoma-associated antigen B1-like [Chrysochloris asiatica]|uniref:Melanoma-associated antigen B1-like n=1 Tax=Chrysochloris asiatica TaxID=185453 RepID=A0A9B0TBF7_CHRAS|nr:PREDICTED: melanoma-associated antigen B1-like [Chrysochloris asiatica]
MPRGQKSKMQARKKRSKAQADTHDLEGAQAAAIEEERSSRSSSPSVGNSQQSLSEAPSPPEPQRAPTPYTASAEAVCTDGAEGANGQVEGSSNEAPTPSTQKSPRDPVIWRTSLLLLFLLHKYKMKELITKKEMMKIINKKYKEHFPQILRRVSEHMELVFGLELKEVDPKGQSYALVSQLEITKEENITGVRGFPKLGLLMPLLGVIYMNNYRATEESIWEFLSALGIYDGQRHFIFGEPRKLLTRDLVQEKYLEYRQVPGSDPPCYEFLWGPRTHIEANKKKVQEFLVKIKNIDPSDFQAVYEETWGDEEERGAATAWIGIGRNARAMARFRAKSMIPPRVLLLWTRVVYSRGLKRPPSTTTTSVANSCRRLDEGVNRENEDHSGISETERCSPDPRTIKADLLERFLIYKYKMKQPIHMADMLKVISRKYKDHFPEILKIVSECIETMFAVDVKEIDSTTKSYALVSKLNLPNKGRVRAGIGLPKTGLLMTLLGAILLNGNRATEKEIWEFLNKMRKFAGRKHFIYGEPRQLITKDFVRLNFLEYRQIPNSDPPCSEFLWGPKAHAETSKVKIFAYLAKVNGILPSSLEALYEEAVRDEEGIA